MTQKKIFLIPLLFLTAICYSQNLTYTDLKYLIEHNIEDADIYLTKKNFEYYKTEKGEYCNTMNWSCERNKNNNRATAFIAKTCFEANEGFIWYQPPSKITFEEIKKNCKTIGYTLLKSEIDPLGSLRSTYVGSKYKIDFTSGIHDESNENVYAITLNLK